MVPFLRATSPPDLLTSLNWGPVVVTAGTWTVILTALPGVSVLARPTLCAASQMMLKVDPAADGWTTTARLSDTRPQRQL